MGNCFSNHFGKNKRVWVLMIGLDAAGKTTILYNLKFNEYVDTIPTIGFNIEDVHYKRIVFNVWDINGSSGIRPLTRHYYSKTQAIIYVIDTNDQDRINEAKEFVHQFCKDEEIMNVPILFYLNKIDLPNALAKQEIIDKMELQSIVGHEWACQECCGTTGYGLYEGLNWLYSKFI
ncbi:ADP-ribosylation factor, putative [Entamoeba invadens IP1]|uniref:ADP-ribosylation factor, putative n=1 Tax=Entamoeba invadens IP1 TaxID=370355 RepID=L7FJY9_ENTIV|nr:ADP-ribosylation factor, putative [Entamoeba invadens IP1]ELP83633.1 ADP-ribosylation factor, putative [Entamoeba invadens IP1]|eukprot:XP_004182979.1 ADP-ribosylation factor, putative [Entamoeba invadens IP1]